MEPSSGSALVGLPDSWAYHMRNLRKSYLSATIYHPLNIHLLSTSNRRLRVPESLPPYEGNYEAHKFGSSCPQQRMTLPEGLDPRLAKDVNDIVARLYEDVTPDSEDCKTCFIE
jgi:hypothetical protein